MRHPVIVILFFIGLIFFVYLNIMMDITWKELVAGYCLILIMLFTIVIFKQMENISEKAENLDRINTTLEASLEKIINRLESIESRLGGR